MAGAFGWGTLAASSLVIGALIALRFHISFHISLRVIGLIMAFGSGVLISAVAFDLVEEAAGMLSGSGWVIAGIFIGCGVILNLATSLRERPRLIRPRFAPTVCRAFDP